MGNPKEKPRPHASDAFHREQERIFNTEQGARFVAKVVRDVLGRTTFTDPAGLRDAVESRCAQLGVRCSRDLLERALDLVGSNAKLLKPSPTTGKTHRERTAAPAPSHGEAKALLDKLGVDVSGGRFTKRSDVHSRLTPM